MPESQTPDEPRTREGQWTAGGREQQGPGPAPTTNSEGQVVADRDGDAVEGQDTDIGEVHPSSGMYPNTSRPFSGDRADVQSNDAASVGPRLVRRNF
jgi:hypothetical protein